MGFKFRGIRLQGVQRLPRLVGAISALDVMLSGRRIPAKSAVAMGIADELVPSDNGVLGAAIALCRAVS